MAHKVFTIVFILIFVGTSCNRVPYWRIVSKDCYEQTKIDFSRDSLYFQEVESILKDYLNSDDFINQRERISFEDIDSIILDQSVVASLKRFCLKKNIYQIYVDDETVKFTFDDCISKKHSSSHPSIIQYYKLYYIEKSKEEKEVPQIKVCGDSIYCLDYRLSSYWYYLTTVVQ